MKNVVDIQGTLCLPIRIYFVKQGPSKYMSHLDLMRCMIRTLRRADVPIWYTEGFNPHPFMTFALPLSLGMTGLCESMDVRLTDSLGFDEIKRRLNRVLCEGIEVTEVNYVGEKATAIHSAVYRVSLAAEGIDGAAFRQRLTDFFSQNEITVQKKNKKKQFVPIDIKPHVLDYAIAPEGEGAILTLRLPAGNELNINPSLLLKAFEEWSGMTFRQCDITREQLLTEEGKAFR